MRNQNIDINQIKFIGVGAVKSGTTWLAKCIGEHPQAFIPYQKEVCFFDIDNYQQNYLKGIKWYLEYFNNEEAKDKILGEFTTHYIFLPHSAKLIKKHLPNIKLIICIRQPIDMIYSFYWWKKANYETSDLPNSFEKAIEVDPTFIERGMYYKQVKRFYDLFSKNQIKVFLYDEIKKNPLKVIKESYEFIGVDSNFIPTNYKQKINTAKKPRSLLIANLANHCIKSIKFIGLKNIAWRLISNNRLSQIYSRLNKSRFEYPPLKTPTRRKLLKLYKNDINNLQRLIGKDLSFWIKQ